MRNRWLTSHRASPQELRDLLAAARSDLADARKDLSPAWRFAIAYNAALRLCTVVLEGSGYRATRDQKHYRTIAALPLILGADAQDLADYLDQCRSKRHDVTYEALSAVSRDEAEELIEAVAGLEKRVQKWLRSRTP